MVSNPNDVNGESETVTADGITRNGMLSTKVPLPVFHDPLMYTPVVGVAEIAVILMEDADMIL